MFYNASYEDLRNLVEGRLTLKEVSEVEAAYRLAEVAHSGQTRDEGTPYIIHPLRVAISLVTEADTTSRDLVCSALLHDVIEDSEVTREEIAGRFGESVAEVVWLLTKFEDTRLSDYLAAIEARAETGAPLVKLCDRLDNLRFLARSPKLEKQRRYVYATETFYLPFAERTHPRLHGELLRSLETARGLIGSAEEA